MNPGKVDCQETPRKRPPSSDELAGAGDDPRVFLAMEEYLALRKAGKKPDRHEFLARYAEIADELAECLDGWEFIQKAGSQLQQFMTPMEEASLDATDVTLGTPLGDFRILRQIGRGGMGIVYEAEQLSLKRRVALKVLPFAAALDPRQLQRFRTEAEAAARLHHTHIVPVYAVGSERGVHYYAMQFIDGQTLAQVVRELRRLSGLEPFGDAESSALFSRGPVAECGPSHPSTSTPTADSRENKPGHSTQSIAALTTKHFSNDPAYFRTIAQLGIQAAEALDYAHGAGVVHRDIKPANLLVETQGKLWVTDFGLARLHSDAGMTRTGDIVGTLRYMSPEQALGQRTVLDHRTDLYSLGVTLYELLTLRPAFAGDNREALLRQITSEDPLSPRRVRKEVPTELETIVLKAMARDREDRYATAQELADDLRRFLEDRPIQARRPTPLQRASKWVSRHRSMVAGAVAGLVVILFVLAYYSVLLWQGKEETARALAEAQAKSEEVQRQKEETEKALAQAQANFTQAEEQKRKAQENEQRAKAHREGEHQRYKQAQKVMDLTYTRFVERLLAGHPHHLGLQREYLREALQFYEEIAALAPPGADATGLASPERAEAYRRVGDIRHRIGEDAKAEMAYRQAIELLEKLTNDIPADRSHQRNLARALHHLGQLLADSRRFTEAVQTHRRALDLREKLFQQDMEEVEYHRDLALSHHHLGSVLEEAGQPKEARAAYEAALSLREKLAADFPAEPDYRQDLATTQNDLGILLLQTGQPKEGEQLLRQALALAEKLAEDGSVATYRARLASTCRNLGTVHARGRRPDQAEKLYERALTLFEKVTTDFPTIPAYRNDLADTWHSLAQVHIDLNQNEKADRSFQQALAVREKLVADYPARPRFQDSLASTFNNWGILLLRGGQLKEAEKGFQHALDIWQKLIETWPREPDYRFRLACASDNLSVVLLKQGKVEESEAATRRTLELLERLTDEFPNRADYKRQQSACCTGLGALLAGAGRHQEAEKAFRQAVKIQPSSLPASISLSWFLAICPDPEVRNPTEAVELAKKAVEAAPRVAVCWRTLGVACCQTQDWPTAQAALEKSIELKGSGDGYDWFFLAKVQWHRDDKTQARQSYERACQWMEKNRPDDIELRRFRTEAATLLGVSDSQSDR